MTDFTMPQIKSCGTFFSDVLPQRTEVRPVEFFEIELFTSNGAKFFLDGKEYLSKKGYVLIAKPGQKRINHLPFSTIYLKVIATGFVAEELKNTPDLFLPSQTEEIEALLKDLILLKQTPGKEILYNSRFLGFIDKLIKEARSASVQTELHDDLIQRAKAYIKENFNKPVRLKDIARTSHLSDTYFHKIFTAKCGLSPNEYLTACRIDESKKLLGFTRISIGEISEKCGFCSQQYFNKIFKNKMGISPSAYRKNIATKDTF